MPNLTRRAVCAGLPAIAAGTAADSAQTSTPDPILRHYRAWFAARTRWAELAVLPGNEDWDLPESVEMTELEMECFRQMCNLRATTREGFIALAHVNCTEHPNADTYEGAIALALWRSVAGCDGVPPLDASAIKPSVEKVEAAWAKEGRELPEAIRRDL